MNRKKSDRIAEWVWLQTILARFQHLGPRTRMGHYTYPTGPLSKPGTRQNRRRRHERRTRGGGR